MTMFWKTAGVWRESSGKRRTSRGRKSSGKRHTGMDCRYPGYRDVSYKAIHGAWIHAGLSLPRTPGCQAGVPDVNPCRNDVLDILVKLIGVKT
jgi:hypothetical protein